MKNSAVGTSIPNLRQSMQSIFSGQTLGMNSNEIERNEDAKDQESGDEDDDDDDDIERDETAEVIEPVRHRNQSQTS